MDFWNDVATDRSWKALIGLKKRLNFVLIGGWACYLHTGSIKSKDIDIIADFDALDRIKGEFLLKKNPHLRKYEIAVEGISVDIYVPFYSRLAIPVEDIQKNCTSIEGFRVPRPEALLILKQGAEMERGDSVKGQKDRVDILNLLLNAGPDMEEYRKLAGKFKLTGFPRRLMGIIQASGKEWEYLGIRDLRKIRLLKEKLKSRIRA